MKRLTILCFGILLNLGFGFSQDELVQYELKNDDGTREEAHTWGTTEGNPYLWGEYYDRPTQSWFWAPFSSVTCTNLVEDNYYGFAERLTPVNYPFSLKKVKLYINNPNSISYGIYIHVWNEQNVNLLPSSLFIPSSQIKYGWNEIDISAYNIIIQTGRVKVGFCQRYLPTLNLQGYYPPATTIGVDKSSSGNGQIIVNRSFRTYSLGSYVYMMRAIGLAPALFTFESLNIKPLHYNPNTFNKLISEASIIQLFYKVTDNENKPVSNHSLKIHLTDGSSTINTTSEFVNDTTVKVTFLGKDLKIDAGGNVVLSFQNSVFVDGIEIPLSVKPTDILFHLTKQDQNLEYDIFAGGSLGGSVLLGSLGAGASVSAARLSISGHGGMGLNLKFDELGTITFSRRFERGISANLKFPSVNIVADDITFGAKVSLDIKPLNAHTLKFEPNDASVEAKMTQSGFFLESLATCGANLSPLAGVVLDAINSYAFKMDAYDNLLNNYLASTKFGIGVEGEGKIGLDTEILSKYLPVKIIGISGGLNLIHSKTKYLENENGTEIDSISIDTKYGTSFDVSLLDLDIGNGENFKVNLPTLFESNHAWMIEYSSVFKDDALKQISYSYLLGEDASLSLISDKKLTEVEFKFTEFALPRVLHNFEPYDRISFALNQIIGSPLNIGYDIISSGLNYKLDLATTFYQSGQEPVYVSTYSTSSRGYDLPLEISLDAALGAGVGIDLGLKLQYLKTERYLKSKSLLLDNDNFWEVQQYSSPSFDQYPTLKESVTDLLSGIIPLLSDELRNLIMKFSAIVNKGGEFLINAADQTKEFALKVKGLFNSDGTFSVLSNDPKVNRVIQNPFNPPEIKSMYISTSMSDNSLSLKGKGAEEKTLIVISDNFILNFYNSQGIHVKEFESYVKLTFAVRDNMLLDNDLPLGLKNSVFAYHYIDSMHYWQKVDMDLSPSSDTVVVDVKFPGSYALGVEYLTSDDKIPPQISDILPTNNPSFTDTLLISAKITENDLGSGLNLSMCYLILDNDTLDALWNPITESLLYSYTDDLNNGVHNLRVIAVDFNGNTAEKNLSFTMQPNSIDEGSLSPLSYVKTYPNPSSGQVTIEFFLPTFEKSVDVLIYDINGMVVNYQTHQNLCQGVNQVFWCGDNQDSRQVPQGIYFIHIRSSKLNLIKKIVRH